MSDGQRAQAAATKLYIRLERDRLDEASSLLKQYPGTVPVYLHIPSEKTTLLCPADSWVNLSSAMTPLVQRFGEENVKPVSK